MANEEMKKAATLAAMKTNEVLDMAGMEQLEGGKEDDKFTGCTAVLSGGCSSNSTSDEDAEE